MSNSHSRWVRYLFIFSGFCRKIHKISCYFCIMFTLNTQFNDTIIIECYFFISCNFTIIQNRQYFLLFWQKILYSNLQKRLKYMEKQDRQISFDIMRTLACLSVIYRHISGEFLFRFNSGEMGQKIVLFSNRMILMSVPVFIFVAGIVILYKKENIGNLKTFYKKKFHSIIPVYVIFSVFYYFLNHIVYQKYLYQQINVSVSGLFQSVLLGDSLYHLYFIPLIAQLYILAPLLTLAVKKMSSAVLSISFLVNFLFIKYANFPYSDRFFLRYILWSWRSIFNL